jgi:hypothetical protein
MSELKAQDVEVYLSSVYGRPVTVLALASLGETPNDKSIKFYGYGTPVRVDYQPRGGAHKSAVLHTMHPGPFGHEYMEDRAQVLLWEHRSFNKLPSHVRSLDVGGFRPGGNLATLGDITEFFLLTEYVEGQPYALDLETMRDRGTWAASALDRADALCDYLVGIHRVKGNDPGIYVRRIRELLGHGECIMGISDSYPEHALITAKLLAQIEHRCLDWRWRLKTRSQRLSQVHGDFHPWNILFRSGVNFTVLDRSRGEYGDPADDVASLTMNYFFFSLQSSGRLGGIFETIFLRFWDRYLAASGDHEMLEVVAPFFAFRGLVMASPLWYPTLSDTIRQCLITFITAVLEIDRFDPKQVNAYLGV